MRKRSPRGDACDRRRQGVKGPTVFVVAECPLSDDGMERFACPTADRMGRYRCIDDHVLCDGFIDCPGGEDEDRQACMFYKTVSTRRALCALAPRISHVTSPLITSPLIPTPGWTAPRVMRHTNVALWFYRTLIIFFVADFLCWVRLSRSLRLIFFQGKETFYLNFNFESAYGCVV